MTTRGLPMIRTIIRFILAWFLLPAVISMFLFILITDWLFDEPEIYKLRTQYYWEGWAKWAIPWWKP